MPVHPHRLEMTVALASHARTLVPGGRRPRPDDLQALAKLMFDAYQGTVDYAGETVEDAAQEIEKTLAGGYGVYLAQHSWVVVREESQLVCATLVTRRDDGPLLAFAMTASGWKRRGLAKATIVHVMQDLFEAGETQLQLALHAKNQPALDLYRSLGFKELRRDA